MICDPCKEPHQPSDCEDSKAARPANQRHCYCQHKPRQVATSAKRPRSPSLASSIQEASDHPPRKDTAEK